jgi:hypothetical protein
MGLASVTRVETVLFTLSIELSSFAGGGGPAFALPLPSPRTPRPSALSASVVAFDSQIPNVYAPIPTPQIIFHAFAQPNRMSSPQTHKKTNNHNPINKIKLSASDF